MNTEVMFSNASDMWATPQDFFDALDREFRFTIDVCATAENAKCERYFSPEQDGLAQDWRQEAHGGYCWCNPPYGREIGKWVKHEPYTGNDGREYQGARVAYLLTPDKIATLPPWKSVGGAATPTPSVSGASEADLAALEEDGELPF